MTRVLNRLAKANRLVDPDTRRNIVHRPPHVVVNIGNAEPMLDTRLQMVKMRMRALRAKQARCAATGASHNGIFSAHPAIYFTIAVFVFCVGGLRAWPY